MMLSQLRGLYNVDRKGDSKTIYERMLKETVKADCTAVSRYVPGGTEEWNEKCWLR